MVEGLRLYSYWRSSAAYRVRIALNLKGLDYEIVPVHLVRDGGEQHSPEYRKINPQELVPTLVDGRRVIRQSVAIVEYLDETYDGEMKLLPPTARDRARVRSLAMLVACDIHPLNNTRVMRYLDRELGADDAARHRWMRHWMEEGFASFEELVARHPSTGLFCEGDTPTLADICLVPQVYNARRFGVDLSPYPTIEAIVAACMQLEAFDRARPENQPDAEA
ncbi:MAG TPA: maleylacetoacetate isomerase [Rhodanobacteraceae bacterium]|nr:maleylacetoacetate isomerase [Rhodanobacteraceae bacterium]